MRTTCRSLLAAIWLFAGCEGLRAEEAPAPTTLFPVGEELFYDVHWGFLHVGYTHVTTSWTNRQEKKLIHVRFATRTNRVVEKLYPVDDLIEAMIDPATMLPVLFAKRLSEGRYRTDEETVFDHATGQAVWRSRKSNRTKTFPIEPDTRCLVSIMYYLRGQQFSPGEKYEYQVMADEKLFDLFVNVRKEEKLKLPPWGEVPCLKIEPEAAFQGLFVRKGKITMWVAQGERRVCTRIVGEIPVASVKLTLTGVKGPGDDTWVKPPKKS